MQARLSPRPPAARPAPAGARRPARPTGATTTPRARSAAAMDEIALPVDYAQV
jgi:hypothetical protein